MNRYVFSIHSNTKWGIDLGVSFITCWCASDSDAIAIGTVLNQYLCNYAKVSVSKILLEAPTYEVPDSGAILHDVGIQSFVLTNEDGSVRRTVKVPLNMVPDGGTWSPAGLAEVGQALVQYAKSQQGQPFTSIMASGIAIKNVVSGGPVGPNE